MKYTVYILCRAGEHIGTNIDNEGIKILGQSRYDAQSRNKWRKKMKGETG